MRFVLEAIAVLAMSLALLGNRIENRGLSTKIAPVDIYYMNDQVHQQERQKLFAKFSPKARAIMMPEYKSIDTQPDQ